MPRRRGRAGAGPVAAILAGSLVFTSCSQLDGLVGERETEPRTATVAVLVPSDDDGDLNSTGVIAAVRAAVAETTAGLDDWDVSVEVLTAPVDDDSDETGDDQPEGDPDLLETLETLLDDDLVAVVGGLDTSAVRTAQPVLDARDVVFVSPSDVLPEHTRGADPTAPIRPYASYFRTAVGDGDPVVAAMRYAAAVEGVDAVTVLDTDGGAEPARGEAAAEAVGLDVVAPGGRDEGDDDGDQDADEDAAPPALTGPVADAADLDRRVDAAVATEAPGVYAATDPSRLAAVFTRLATAGSAATVVGGAAFDGDSPPESGEFTGTILRGRAAELPTTMDATPDGMDAALDGAAPGRFGAAAYDAGTIVGTVLASCLPSAASAPDARTGCLGEMDETRVAGVTGEIVFDAYGDRVGGTAVVEGARNGSWAALTSD